MNLQEKLELCSSYYKKWKEKALSSQNLEQGIKAMQRAFFWLEMHSAFLTLELMEHRASSEESLRKLILAKANLAKKLIEYSEDILEEIEWLNK
jgi:hypothetical protein